MRKKRDFIFGFTLIELVTVIAITGIVAGLTVPFIVAAIDSWQKIATDKEILANARFAINRMVREARNATAVNNAKSTRFRFTDANGDTIEFRQRDIRLQRRLNSLGRVELATNLKDPGGLEFIYYDSNGDTTTHASGVRMVQVTLILESGDSQVRLRSLAWLRNI